MLLKCGFKGWLALIIGMEMGPAFSILAAALPASNKPTELVSGLGYTKNASTKSVVLNGKIPKECAAKVSISLKCEKKTDLEEAKIVFGISERESNGFECLKTHRSLCDGESASEKCDLLSKIGEDPKRSKDNDFVVRFGKPTKLTDCEAVEIESAKVVVRLTELQAPPHPEKPITHEEPSSPGRTPPAKPPQGQNDPRRMQAQTCESCDANQGARGGAFPPGFSGIQSLAASNTPGDQPPSGRHPFPPPSGRRKPPRDDDDDDIDGPPQRRPPAGGGNSEMAAMMAMMKSGGGMSGMGGMGSMGGMSMMGMGGGMSGMGGMGSMGGMSMMGMGGGMSGMGGMGSMGGMSMMGMGGGMSGMGGMGSMGGMSMMGMGGGMSGMGGMGSMGGMSMMGMGGGMSGMGGMGSMGGMSMMGMGGGMSGMGGMGSMGGMSMMGMGGGMSGMGGVSGLYNFPGTRNRLQAFSPTRASLGISYPSFSKLSYPSSSRLGVLGFRNR